MPFRLIFVLAALAICLGCTDGSKNTANQPDEEKNPYLVAGRDYVTARDYKRATRAFEKVLEENPNSALAHYELGLINEQQDNDYVSAIYHYRCALKLRPDAYPADNAKVRIASCKQELVKAELVAPVAQGMVRELDRLKQENAQLRKQLEAFQAGAMRRGPDHLPRTNSLPVPPRRAQAPQRSSSGPTASSERITPLPPATRGNSRVHVIRSGDTMFSICRSYGISPETLAAANPQLRPRHLIIGQRVHIPGP